MKKIRGSFYRVTIPPKYHTRMEPYYDFDTEEDAEKFRRDTFILDHIRGTKINKMFSSNKELPA